MLNIRRINFKTILSILSCFFIHTGVSAQFEPPPADVKPEELLKEAAKKWDLIDDYQALIHQIEIEPNGEQMERWALVTLIKEDQTPDHSKPRPSVEKGKDNLSLFRLDFFKSKVTWDQVHEGVVQGQTPVTIYYSQSMERLFTYKPEPNALTIDPLDENAPIKEFLYLAGFAEYNIDRFFEEVYVDEHVYEETINEEPTYRIRMILKTKVQEIAPPRLLWIDQKTLFPKRFSVEGDVAIRFHFIDWKIDQDLNFTKLIPEVPSDVFVVDHTKRRF